MRWLIVLSVCLVPPAARADFVYDNGTVNTLTTVINDNVQVRDSATGATTTLDFAGGRVTGNVSAYGSSVVNVVPPSNPQFSTLADLFAHDSSRVTLGGAGPLFTDNLSADGNARLTVNNAETISVTAAGNSTVVINSLNVHNGGPITTSGTAHLTVNGLTESGLTTLNFGGSSVVEWDAGSFFSMRVTDMAQVTWTGDHGISLFGGPQSVSVSGDGLLTVVGTGFNFGYGRLPVDSGTLTGTLEDGQSFRVTFTGGADIILAAPAAVPEPGSLVLLGVGAGCLGAWRWRRRAALRRPS